MRKGVLILLGAVVLSLAAVAQENREISIVLACNGAPHIEGHVTFNFVLNNGVRSGLFLTCVEFLPSETAPYCGPLACERVGKSSIPLPDDVTIESWTVLLDASGHDESGAYPARHCEARGTEMPIQLSCGTADGVHLSVR